MDDYSAPPYPIPLTEQFETVRLLVRRTTINDQDPLTPTLKNPATVEGFGLGALPDPQVFVDNSVARWLSGTCWTFTIIDKVSNQVAGFERVDIRPREGGGSQGELTIALAPDSQRKGYASEAVRGLIAWVFNSVECPSGVTLNEIQAACLPTNYDSLRFFGRLATNGLMKDEGERKGASLMHGPGSYEAITVHVFSVTRENWVNNTE